MRVIIVGGGKTAYFVAKRFQEQNARVTVITPEEREAQAFAMDLQARVLLGDGTTPVLLLDAEAGRADAVVAVMPRDEDNLVACLLARRLFSVERFVALVNDPENLELFQRLGISGTFSTADLLARLIGERTGSAEVTSLIPLAGGQAQVSEVVLPAGAPATGSRIQDLRLPPGTLIAMVIRESTTSVPWGGTVLRSGDRLLLICQPETYGPMLRALLGRRA
jgi:trk system potassium uptake protein TrkA